MKIKLFTRSHDLVHETEIPTMNPPPEMIAWGARAFAKSDTSEANREGQLIICYEEGMLYHVVRA